MGSHLTLSRCEEELIEAIETANGEKKDCLCFIEVIVHTSEELLEWGPGSLQPIAAHQFLSERTMFQLI